ncbi:hypothetical protein PMZ80_004024 [Knufia obscura]|uniref:Uncharacterized protein n=1 Tax=Knufia obscura TaxID=1635080 RepID=A0ABR0RQW1_9EURO|nr:hypothetical protein PMZ80_004024 [Knufia obscura]
MSAEVVTKKRGRPKKVAESAADSASGVQEVPSVTTSKRSTKSRSLSTTETKAAAPKKTTRRKQATTIEDAPPDELETQKVAKPSKTVTKSKASKSTILDEATAFSKLKEKSSTQISPQSTDHNGQQPAVADNNTQSGPAEQVLEALQLKSTPSRTTSTPLNKKASTGPEIEPPTTRATHGESIIKPKKPASESSEEILEALQLNPEPSKTNPQPPKHPQAASAKPVIADKTPDPAKPSSFLSSFLDNTLQEPAPTVSENDKITDRSAFNASNLTAEDIVSGAGVSHLSTLTAPRKPPAPRRPAPKTFKAHTLNAFEHGPHESLHPRRRMVVKQVEPETFGVGSFKAFKAATVSPTSTNNTPPSNDAKAEGPFFTQATSSILPAQGSVAEQSAPPASPPQPHTPAQTRQPPSAQLAQTIRPGGSTSHSQPQSEPAIHPQRKPSEMTYTELKRNSDFKSLRRRWTGLIVVGGDEGERLGVAGGRSRGVVPLPVPGSKVSGGVGGDVPVPMSGSKEVSGDVAVDKEGGS